MLEQLFKSERALQKHMSAPMLREREAYLSELQARGLGDKRIQGVEYFLLRIIDALQIKDGCIHKFTWDEFYAGCQHCYKQSRYGMSEHEKRSLLLDAFGWLDYIGLVDERINKHSLYAEIFPRVDARLRQASYPLLDERLGYIAKCKAEHMSLFSLKTLACYQIRIIELLNLTTLRQVNLQEIEEAANRWGIESKCPCKKQDDSAFSRQAFKSHAISWLSYLTCFQKEDSAVIRNEYLEAYLSWMLKEKGLSPKTCANRRSHLTLFVIYLSNKGLCLENLSANDIDTYVNECFASKKYGRYAISNKVAAIRGFIRYCGISGLCKSELYKSILSPTIYQYESIPYFMPDKNVCSILTNASKSSSRASKRDYAIILMLVTYGFRSSEVANLRLKDIDWRNEIIHIRHAKNFTPQDYPLLQPVGEAIIDYIRNERRNDAHNENLFIRSFYPYNNINSCVVNYLVSKFTKKEDVIIKHYGPHCLRHSFATRMINADKTMKEIADLLGHASVNTTMVYAKVDFKSLHSVSDMNWEGLL